jgi:EAL domain-containing protein (putative c-di-GMP-specific phosphodiesterase class I)/GGDEF domain-containing protein
LSAALRDLAASGSRSLSHGELLPALERALAGAQGTMALLLVDVVDLPALRARMGFEASSDLLQQFAVQFGEALGARGQVLRFGEGCFCVLVHPVHNRGHAVLAGERLMRAAADTVADASVVIAPELTVGIALFPSQGGSAEELLRKAQLAGTTVRRGGARVRVFEDSGSGALIDPWALADRYAEALRAGELQVFYQPKIAVADGKVAGVEALMRWLQDGGRPVATPDVFIPLAEQTGLIQDTTWFALGNALPHMAALGGLPVAVNITPSMLHHPEFVEMVRSALASWSVTPNALTLEITEGALIADLDQATARLRGLRDLGVRISIDDFGTGYSSLSYFKKIPADELKIDKSFVLRMASDEADQRLVGTIISLAKQFQLQIVAEGVEDQATLQMLGRMGCDYVQGHLHSPALSAERLSLWLKTRAFSGNKAHAPMSDATRA